MQPPTTLQASLGKSWISLGENTNQTNLQTLRQYKTLLQKHLIRHKSGSVPRKRFVTSTIQLLFGWGIEIRRAAKTRDSNRQTLRICRWYRSRLLIRNRADLPNQWTLQIEGYFQSQNPPRQVKIPHKRQSFSKYPWGSRYQKDSKIQIPWLPPIYLQKRSC